MRYLTLDEVLKLHELVAAESGGATGLRDLGGLQSAIAQPRMTFGGQDLYPTLVEKAAALAFSLIKNHPFMDGNKRIGHSAMEVFLLLNGHEIDATVEDGEQTTLGLAAGTITREAFTDWLKDRLRPFTL